METAETLAALRAVLLKAFAAGIIGYEACEICAEVWEDYLIILDHEKDGE